MTRTLGITGTGWSDHDDWQCHAAHDYSHTKLQLKSELDLKVICTEQALRKKLGSSFISWEKSFFSATKRHSIDLFAWYSLDLMYIHKENLQK